MTLCQPPDHSGPCVRLCEMKGSEHMIHSMLHAAAGELKAEARTGMTDKWHVWPTPILCAGQTRLIDPGSPCHWAGTSPLSLCQRRTPGSHHQPITAAECESRSLRVMSWIICLFCFGLRVAAYVVCRALDGVQEMWISVVALLSHWAGHQALRVLSCRVHGLVRAVFQVLQAQASMLPVLGKALSGIFSLKSS